MVLWRCGPERPGSGLTDLLQQDGGRKPSSSPPVDRHVGDGHRTQTAHRVSVSPHTFLHRPVVLPPHLAADEQKVLSGSVGFRQEEPQPRASPHDHLVDGVSVSVLVVLVSVATQHLAGQVVRPDADMRAAAEARFWQEAEPQPQTAGDQSKFCLNQPIIHV